MKHNKNARIMEHIIEYCEDVTEAVRRFEGDKRKFMSDRIFRNACAMPLMQIGELAKNLTDDVLQLDASVPWKEIKGMRDYFAHEYHEMDADIIWNTIEEIPSFQKQCLRLLDQIRS